MARIFIAIRFDDDIKSILVDIQEGLKRAGIRGNYCSWDNLHMTLAFIGEHCDVGAVREAVNEVEFAPFSLTLSTLGTFPTRAGVIWCGVREEPAVMSLAARLRERLTANGVAYSRTSFYPHISLVQHPSSTHIDVPIPPTTIHVRQIHVMVSQRINGELLYTEL